MATATPYVVNTINSVEFGVGDAACDTTDSFFDPDPLDTSVVPVDGWVDTATSLPRQSAVRCDTRGNPPAK